MHLIKINVSQKLFLSCVKGAGSHLDIYIPNNVVMYKQYCYLDKRCYERIETTIQSAQGWKPVYGPIVYVW